MVNSPTTRVTRSFRHRDMGSIQAAESPSFSIGVGDSNNRRTTTRQLRRNTSAVQANSPSANNNNRRSTRRAAQTARTIIAQELAPQRRSRARAASKPDSNNTNSSSSPAVRRNQPSQRIQASTTTTTSSPTRRRTTNTSTARKQPSSPIDLCDSDSTVEDLKPAAKTELSSAIAGASSLAVKPPPLEDITCPICLDTPSSMTQVASISGCAHKFCFNCIDKWADTENKW